MTCGIECCPDYVIAFAIIGAGVVYALLAFMFYQLIKSIWENIDESALFVLAILWPLAIVMGIVFGFIYYVSNYLIRLLVIMPIFGVEKYDLEKTEMKLSNQIKNSEGNIRKIIRGHVEEYHPVKAKRKSKKTTKTKKTKK